MTPISFEQILALTEREPTQKVIDVKPHDRDRELRVYVIKHLENYRTKTNVAVRKFWVADSSGSIYMNFYGEDIDDIKEADILYVNGVYASVYKRKMALHVGKSGICRRLGEFIMEFQVNPNISLLDTDE